MVPLTEKLAWVFDLSTGRLKFLLRHEAPVTVARFNLSGKLLLTASADDQCTEWSAWTWDTATGKPIGRPIKHKDGVLDANFSPEGTQIVTAGEDFTALISGMEGTVPPKQLVHNHQVRAASFNPKGSRVLTVGRDQTARVWDAHSGEPITPALPHFAQIWHGRFVGESMIAISDQKNKTWVWKLHPARQSQEELVSWARVLNGDMTDANKAPADSYAELLQCYNTLKIRY